MSAAAEEKLRELLSEAAKGAGQTIQGDPVESIKALAAICGALHPLDQGRRRAILWTACEMMLDQPK